MNGAVLCIESAPQSWLQFSFLVPVLATVAGWIVVSRQNDYRVRRQEIRDHIDEVRLRCDTAVEAATSYWCTGTGPERASSAVKLKATFAAISRIIKTLEAAGLEFSSWHLVADFRQAATGDEFEVKGRRRKASDNEKILDTARAADDLIGAIDDAYFEKFRVRKPNGMARLLAPLGFLAVAQDTSKAA